MFLLIDNYDSFTYNLFHYLEELGAEVRVVRNDAVSVADVLALGAEGVILSPGPCTPDEAGICLELLNAAPASLPILGVCLGHQAIGQAFGGTVVGAKSILHGKLSAVSHSDTGLFAGLPSPFAVTRYHSLAVRRGDLPEVLVVDAETPDGEIMAMHHRDRPIYGLQFHPESIASEHGHALLKAFLRKAKVRG
jgi:anthranilate synthase component II